MIKKRNLDNSLIQWIMTQSGIGPGIGKIHYVARADSTARQYRAWLQDMGVEIDNELHTGVAAGYNAMQSYRNDVMLLYPAWYNTAAFAWAKHKTFLFGMNPGMTMGSYGSYGTVIYQSVTTAGYTMDMSGSYNVFKNVGIHAYGNAATALSALKLNGTNSRFEGCDILGIGGTTAGASANTAALWVPAESDHGRECEFINCGFRDANAARTAAAGGIILFGTPGSDGGNCGVDMRFIGCRIRSRSDTAGCHLVAIRSPMDGLIEWKDCTFYNHAPNQGTTLTDAFYVGASGTYVHVLRNCNLSRITAWQGEDTGYIYTADADCHATGGAVAEAT